MPQPQPFLQSVDAFTESAKTLVSDVHHFAEGGGLDSMTDNAVGPQPMLVIRTIRDYADGFAIRAARLIANADNFARLDPALQADIQLVATEYRIGADEITAATLHDNVWTALSDQQKNDVTQRLPSNDLHVAAIRARLKGQKQGEAAGNFFKKK